MPKVIGPQRSLTEERCVEAELSRLHLCLRSGGFPIFCGLLQVGRELVVAEQRPGSELLGRHDQSDNN